MELTKNEKDNLGGILLNHMANYTKDAPAEMIIYDINMYNKLTSENLTLDYVKKYIMQ